MLEWIRGEEPQVESRQDTEDKFPQARKWQGAKESEEEGRV